MCFFRKLTRVLNYYVGHAEEPLLTERLYGALKALKYLFRFIVQSRVLYLRYQSRRRRHTSVLLHSDIIRAARFDASAVLCRFPQILREQRGWGRFLKLHSNSLPLFQHSHGPTAG